VLDPSGLVNALVAEPVAVRDLIDARLEAVGVVALVATRRLRKNLGHSVLRENSVFVVTEMVYSA